MKIASIKTCDIANGSGIGVSIWVTGCSLHCKGCFNPHLWDKDACGHDFCQEDIDKIISELSLPYIDHLSILGGNPTDAFNIYDVITLCKAVKAVYGSTKKIFIWSGHTQDELMKMPAYHELTKHIDKLIVGRFIEERKCLDNCWYGSTNQRIITFK